MDDAMVEIGHIVPFPPLVATPFLSPLLAPLKRRACLPSFQPLSLFNTSKIECNYFHILTSSHEKLDNTKIKEVNATTVVIHYGGPIQIIFFDWVVWDYIITYACICMSSNPVSHHLVLCMPLYYCQ
jgi:hypothetical protein